MSFSTNIRDLATRISTEIKVLRLAVQADLDNKADSSALAAVALSGDAGDLTGTLPSSALPPLGISDIFVVASQAAMLALTVQRGDVAVRTDSGKTYILSTDSPDVLGDWKELIASGAVTSVAGRSGNVSLTKTDVGLDQVDNTSDANKPVSSATQAALDDIIADIGVLTDFVAIFEDGLE